MKLYLSKRTTIGFCVIVVTAIISGFFTISSVNELIESQVWISRAYQVIDELTSIQSIVFELVASVRGYVITEDGQFLSTYEQTSSLLNEKVNNLKELTKDDPLQKSNVEILTNLIKQRIEYSSEIINTRKSEGFDAANKLIISDKGEVQVKQSKLQTATMIDLENNSLQKRIHDSQVIGQNVTLSLVSSIVMIASITIVLLTLFNNDAKKYQMETQRKLSFGERRNLELTEFNKLKDEFSAMITHELKTPLVPITGYCKMLKNRMIGDLNQEQQEAIEVIDRNAKRIEILIGDIMDARKLDLDKMKFNIETISVDDFFDNLNLNYKQVLLEKGKEFITNIQTRGLIIKSDKNRMQQVFDNLISNAVKFTPDNGKIEAGCKNEDHKIIFYIKDNGVGIPIESQQNLFKKFYQIDTSERRKIGGTGLGLAISKGIVENLNGRIWVESDGTNGTTFYIEFPI